MTPFERRLKRVEAERKTSSGPMVEVRYWHSPPGMTDLAEQEAWLSEQVAAEAPRRSGRINVHFVNLPRQRESTYFAQ